MSGLRLCLRSRRSVLYLIEPLVAFFAAAVLVVVSQPHGTELPVRLLELHAQDVLGVMQQDGTFERLHGWFLGNEPPGLEAEMGSLVGALNPNYGWRIEVSDGTASKRLGGDPQGDTVSAVRNFVKDGRFFTIKLNIYYRHS